MYVFVVVVACLAPVLALAGFTRQNCETSWRRFNNHCYRYSPLSVTFRAAERACLRRSSTLISLWIEEEKEFVIHKLWKYDIPKTNFLWLGLVAEGNGTWAWLDESEADDPHLIPENHALGLCAGLIGDGRVETYPCNYLAAYICKKAVTVAYAIGNIGNMTVPNPHPNMIRTKATLFEQLRHHQLRPFIHQNMFHPVKPVTKDTDCAIQCFGKADCVGFKVRCISRTKCLSYHCSLLSYTSEEPIIMV